MALSGIQIYKLLPQTNCKECGFPTCLAFAMKLAAKQVELAACPYVSDESQAQLAESSAPPIRLVTLKSGEHEAKAGNEVVLFRHEKTFYNKPGLFIRVKASDGAEAISKKVTEADAYKVNYVGMDFTVDGFAVVADGDAASAVKAVRSASKRPIILIGEDASVLDPALAVLEGETALIAAAAESNWETMADLAVRHKAALVVKADNLDTLAEMTVKIKEKGVENLVLDPGGAGMSKTLANSVQLRRLALKNVRELGYPVISYPCKADKPAQEAILAAQAIAKYSGFIVLETFDPAMIYPLLVLRENIYTDPQKPIQVQPGIYEINSPQPDSPVLVTTNFSITYFSVANEVEGSGKPAWLLVTDADGMSVLTAWAAGKFDAERIAKATKEFNLTDKVSKLVIVLPGHVAVLSGELEEELPNWDVKVGPREAVDIPAYLKQAI
ncbi:MAG: acetyl-CoA decarbonylase/synthase complex subunit gamma [Anaerolineales bacterium]|nr:acetyl-CoA decarbonylase/synthase complex subunit gamma [Anaerolineales bacterium]